MPHSKTLLVVIGALIGFILFFNANHPSGFSPAPPGPPPGPPIAGFTPPIRVAPATQPDEPMDNHEAFLRAMLATPGEAARLAYADWLDKTGDPRGHWLRNTPWPFHLVPENAQAKKPAVLTPTTAPGVPDADWTAFMETLACPFEPFFFFGHQKGGDYTPEELPFSQRIGTRGRVVTFESDFRDKKSWDAGLMKDLGFLTGLSLGDCEYGAASMPIHPFICDFPADVAPITAGDILKALQPRSFRSRYAGPLTATSLPTSPGYHPGNGYNIENDEIHNDFSNQFIFASKSEDDKTAIDENAGAHGRLKQAVVDGRLWYVVLHDTPGHYVVILGVGKSRLGNRLVGVVTHQVCHNLCD